MLKGSSRKKVLKYVPKFLKKMILSIFKDKRLFKKYFKQYVVPYTWWEYNHDPSHRWRLEPELNLVKDFVKDRNSTVIDAGANIGTYTCHFEEFSDHVVAFEPYPPLAQLLLAYAKHNKRVTVYNIGLSDHEGYMDLHTPVDAGDEPATSTFSVIKETHKTARVPVKTIDSFNFKNVSLMKLDVEGHELKVINGALETIKKISPHAHC